VSGFGTGRCDCGRRIEPDEDFCSVDCAQQAQRDDQEAAELAAMDADSASGVIAVPFRPGDA
jgi:hypothetical protein